MSIYYGVKILPPISRKCLSESDLQQLRKFGFMPQQDEDSDEKLLFIAPIYSSDNVDRKYNFVDNAGTYTISPEDNGLFGLLTRIMKRSGLYYLYLTEVDQCIWCG